mmetsp:Transcript_37388/g.54884  ORF Transcript_37388/g.54884 Transcript_37388/m.54884 type:complete len:143 (+) Transcript_37388:251-679(+)
MDEEAKEEVEETEEEEEEEKMEETQGVDYVLELEEGNSGLRRQKQDFLRVSESSLKLVATLLCSRQKNKCRSSKQMLGCANQGTYLQVGKVRVHYKITQASRKGGVEQMPYDNKKVQQKQEQEGAVRFYSTLLVVEGEAVLI